MLLGRSPQVVIGRAVCCAVLGFTACLVDNPEWQAESDDSSGETEAATQTATTETTQSTDTGESGSTGETGTTSPSPPPTVATGGDHTCALVNQTVWCWGANDDGQLGDGTDEDRWSPVQVTGLPAASQISVGDFHTCAVAENNVWCWGRGTSGELGAGTSSSSTPVATAGLPLDEATQVSAGRDSSCAVAQERAWCWGSNWSGRLGAGLEEDIYPTAQDLPAFAGGVEFVVAGGDHGCAIVERLAWCWGHNDSGAALGAGIPDDYSFEPVPVVGLDNVELIVIGGGTGCAREGEAAYCWGQGNSGELGDGLDQTSGVPVMVAGMSTGVTWLSKSAGPDGDSTCAIQSGTMFCWGNNFAGQLGDGTQSDAVVPVRVEGLPATPIQSDGGAGHHCAVLEDGRLYCWGSGTRGQLGDGGGTDSLSPVEVEPTSN